MAEEILVPNGNNVQTWESGGFADVDEDFDSPNDSDLISTTIQSDQVLFDLSDSAITDADTVNSVTVHIRAKYTGSASTNRIGANIAIGGTGQGTANSSNLTTSWANYTITNAAWNSDWTAAQLDGMQLLLVSQQAGMAVSVTWEISVTKVVIDYTPASTTITGSGTPQADTATASGTGEITKTGSGTPQAATATASGTGEVERVGTGTVQAATATASGVGEVEKVGTGAAQAETATASGTGSVGTAPISGSGSPQAATATAAGQGEVIKVGFGTVQAEAATASGTGEIAKTGAGTVQADVATASGVGEIARVGSGSPQADTATAAGVGSVGGARIGSGASAAETATVSGSGYVWSEDTEVMSSPIIVSRSETAVPLSIGVNRDGGITGLTVTCQIRDGETTDSFLDFNDWTFKTSGWTSKQGSLTEVGGGFYGGTLNLANITNLPDSSTLIVEYYVTGVVTAIGIGTIAFASDTIWADSDALTLPLFLGLK